MTAAQPEISQGKKLTAVWIIPLVAVFLGASMVVHSYLTEGPQIEITFDTANGLKSGETRIRYRSIDMGTVTDVSLSEDLEHVVVKARLDRSARSLLKEDSRFWVVRARIGGGGISGLETLLSGAYIQLEPGTSEERATEFKGLEEPPPTAADAPGKRVVLISEDWVDLTSGDAVLYKGFTVGRVESVDYDAESDRIVHVLFIDAPYDDLINSSTRFWNISGISFSTDASGVSVTLGSIETLLHGGVTFDVPEGRQAGAPVAADTEFKLFKSYQAVLDEPFDNRAYYVVEFTQSLRGLKEGAPVELQGIRIGTVERMMIDEAVAEYVETGEINPGSPVPILFYLEPAQLNIPDTEIWAQHMREFVDKAVAQGLHATLKTGSLISGSKYIELDYFPDEPVPELQTFAGYQMLPTVSTGLGQIEHKLIALLDKVNSLPLDQTFDTTNEALEELNQSLVLVRELLAHPGIQSVPVELGASMTSVRELLQSPSLQNLPVELEGSMAALRSVLDNTDTQALPRELRGAMESLRVLLEDENLRAISAEIEQALVLANTQLRGDSAEAYQLRRTLHEVEAAALALREFLSLLETKPEALISGKENLEQ